jgi:hypothetical protein
MQRAQIIVLVTAIALLIFVLEQVRRRKLREEYSWLWLIATLFYLLTATVPGISRWMSGLIGSDSPAITFTFLGLQFVVIILISYSVQFSQLTDRVKNLAQEIAILDGEIKDLRKTLVDEHSNDPSEMERIDKRTQLLTEQVENLKQELRTLQEKIKQPT